MTDDFDGAAVVALMGEPVGKVERTYLDESNVTRFVEVKIGTVLSKHRLIPVEGLSLGDDGRLDVPFSKSFIEDSPEAPHTDTLEMDQLTGIQQYYAGNNEVDDAPGGRTGTITDVASQEETMDTDDQATLHKPSYIDESTRGLRVGDEVPPGLEAPIREVGDVVEVPVLEEVLVKKTVVREILRVKKSEYFEQETVEGDVRKETVEVDDKAGAVVESDATYQ